ncbi:MAG: NUDIX domain-containing protein [Chthoniobacterales bacterium]
MSVYRPNVAMILRDGAGRILIAERLDVAGAWQFPQGGQKKGESAIRALEREVEEELGLLPECYKVIEDREGYRYKFIKGRKKEGFVGQEQRYFLADFLGMPERIAGVIKSPEFRQIRWIVPEEFLPEWVPKFKREVYRQVFKDFFQIDWDI